MSGYTKRQSRELLSHLHQKYAEKASFYYLTCTELMPDGSPPTGFDPAAIQYDQNAQPIANLATVYKIFRREHPSGRWGIWVSAGPPADINSPVLMLDTSWLKKAVVR